MLIFDLCCVAQLCGGDGDFLRVNQTERDFRRTILALILSAIKEEKLTSNSLCVAGDLGSFWTHLSNFSQPSLTKAQKAKKNCPEQKKVSQTR
jgi:hypothetical protein